MAAAIPEYLPMTHCMPRSMAFGADRRLQLGIIHVKACSSVGLMASLSVSHK
jgi:hypothetical protein